MQIGEFAKVCNTKISVLRHYDKEGLLVPDYVDNFTGYRYYSKEQIPVFVHITALKKAGFSLLEIKKILSSFQSRQQLISLFESKKTELIRTLENLDEAEKMILRRDETVRVIFFEENGVTYAQSESFDANDQNKMRNEMECSILKNGYQRISGYITHGIQYSNRVYIICQVIKLSSEIIRRSEDVNIKFEDDSSVVGKWETVGEYAVKEDFYGNICPEDYSAKEIYFLPGGKRYWCYSWSKGKLICQFGDSAFVNDYSVEEYDGNRYMFVEFKSYEYKRGGKPTILVLRQIDNIEYSKDDIARKDNIDLPFVDDRDVIGRWEVRDFCSNIESFDPLKEQSDYRYFKSIEFRENGKLVSNYGESIIQGEHMIWTKGYILNRYNHTASAYKICEIENVKYLFVEWKSGDYIYGNMDPQYYVFTKVLK